MSSDDRDLMISVRGLSKMYTISHVPQVGTTLGEAVMRRLRAPLQKNESETFWALRDVSFDVRRGDVVGIIGRNGAGKSTLLKILSRITEPTKGTIDLYGRIGSLLEVGTGFHPELTGRENIYLNGAILGMSKAEVRRHFDEIVAFAEVDRFLDTPVKRYSSGMYVRLAFAVAAHLNPEILIVDEVLAVGDAAFQQKCLGKMKDVAGSGRTVLFVSHNMPAVQALCNPCILLSGGTLQLYAATEKVVARYFESHAPANGTVGYINLVERQRPGGREPIISSVQVLNGARERSELIPLGAPMYVVVGLQGLRRHRDPRVGIKVKTSNEECVMYFHTGMKPSAAEGMNPDPSAVQFHIPRMNLTPNTYWLELSVIQENVERLDHVERAISFKVGEADVYGTGAMVNQGMVVFDGDWENASAVS